MKIELKKFISPAYTKNVYLRRLHVFILYPFVLLLFIWSMLLFAIIDALISSYKFVVSEWCGAVFHIKDQFQDIKKLWRKDYNATDKPQPEDDL